MAVVNSFTSGLFSFDAPGKAVVRRADGHRIDLTPGHLWDAMLSIMDGVYEEESIMDGMRLFDGMVREVFFS